MKLKKDNILPFLYLVSIYFIPGCTNKVDPGSNWQQGDGYKWTETDPGFWGDTGFNLLESSQTNITFQNTVRKELFTKNRHYLNGSGVAVGDVDGDTLVDIYFASLDGPNVLYKNMGGYRFKDITEKAGVAHKDYNSTGVVFADVNGDYAPDLLVTSLSKGNVLYLNKGEGTFEVKENSGLGDSNGATTMALADVNGDKKLDLYIANYKIKTVQDVFGPDERSARNIVKIVNGEKVIKPPFDQYYTIINASGEPFLAEKGYNDELYINNGKGVFKKVDDQQHFLDAEGNKKGLSEDWGLTAHFQDVNEDMLPDLYVANDFSTPDRFWVNQGAGIFKEIAKNAVRNISYSAMGVDFTDLDRDGSLDYAVTEMLSASHSQRLRQYSEELKEYQSHTLNNRNSVYWNRGDNTFAQIAYYSKLQASGWSWATYFLDVNLDGYEDLIVANGYGYDYQDMDTQLAVNRRRNVTRSGREILEYPPLPLQNRAFKNNGDLTFTNVSTDWGFEEKDISQGMALADLNNDGDMDLVINRFNEEAVIYENSSTAPRIAVRLRSQSTNTFGIGAKVELKGGSVPQKKEIVAGGHYLSGSQPHVVFAANGGPSANYRLNVTWPDGRITKINKIKPSRLYVINDSSAVPPPPVSSQSTLSPMFKDVSASLGHTHHENIYRDFKHQPLLPQRLSREGPGLAWADYNFDGYTDLLVTSGKGGKLGLFQNQENGLFKADSTLSMLTRQASGDQTSIASWNTKKKTYIAIGSANYEQGTPKVPSSFIYSITSQGDVTKQSLTESSSSTGPIAAGDYTGDGQIDLFIGGSFNPGQYPMDAQSRLFINKDGQWKVDQQNASTFAETGLVTSAVFVDINQDRDQDLLVGTEWGTLKLFENDEGVFKEVTSRAGLDRYHGWWKGITVGDFTGNGLPDIVATNIGLNSPYQLTAGQPLKLFYDDFNRDRRLDVIDAYYNKKLGEYVPRRKLHSFGTLSSVVLQNVRSHKEFASSSVDEIFGRNFDDVFYKQINILQHMIFINKNGRFEPHPLPAQTQFTTGFSATVADVNNDGKEDLFISQNFFSFPDGIGRQDAGRGILLVGNGKGEFESLPGQTSGIKVYGEQRGAAFGDFNKDGKVDLAVSQNDSQTKLYQNQTKNRGYRIALQGPENNMTALGSNIRLIYSDGTKGPRRYINAGSGYRSQNSAVQIMGKIQNKTPTTIEVTWFDGTISQIAIKPKKWNYVISY